MKYSVLKEKEQARLIYKLEELENSTDIMENCYWELIFVRDGEIVGRVDKKFEDNYSLTCAARDILDSGVFKEGTEYNSVLVLTNIS